MLMVLTAILTAFVGTTLALGVSGWFVERLRTRRI